ncbi:hypothetical protein BB561_006827, partial [Smittium simulii]
MRSSVDLMFADLSAIYVFGGVYFVQPKIKNNFKKSLMPHAEVYMGPTLLIGVGR